MIEYTFKLADGRSFHFRVDLARRFDRKADLALHPSWTRLEFRQCANCPLKREEFRHCPVALDIEPVITAFQATNSYDKVTVEVRTPERAYSRLCDVQTGLRSLLALLMATSVCPILARLKGLARFHLPFATLEETVFRSAGSYLLRQYYIAKEGGEPDWELRGLIEFYRELQVVDRWLKERIDAASVKDANMNAAGSLIYLAMGVAFSLEDQLEELRQTFAGDVGKK